MKSNASVHAFVLGWMSLLFTSPAHSYVYCGFHDRNFKMTAYHYNSEFWVDMVVAESNKWNRVHRVLSIERMRSNRIPIGTKDGHNVIAWLSDGDLMRAYNVSWGSSVAKAPTLREKNCGRILQMDVIFNPALSTFTAQTMVPYALGFQEVALHELGHVLGLDHDDTSLSVMTTGQAVSNVLHHNDKVGWNRSAAQKFNPLPNPFEDMGIFPLRNVRGGGKTYSSVSQGLGREGRVTIKNFTVENLSPVFPYARPAYRLILENVSTGTQYEIGTFSWGNFPAFSEWSGDLTFTVPITAPRGEHRVVAVFKGTDSDATNDRAVFGIFLN
jgi:hypothetical protein